MKSRRFALAGLASAFVGAATFRSLQLLAAPTSGVLDPLDIASDLLGAMMSGLGPTLIGGIAMMVASVIAPRWQDPYRWAAVGTALGCFLAAISPGVSFADFISRDGWIGAMAGCLAGFTFRFAAPMPGARDSGAPMRPSSLARDMIARAEEKRQLQKERG
ncbi:hypothetical protein [Sphingomicrobium arenosum]|uniref:hypothetical protein n=1 Tax=Sphingomicrobium arenosum TaxID=2233861 RepID=UPI00223F6A99|nr:hypothetical protein [Sphingomicrobium arenosum]